jgi:hypothetical protein
VDQATAGAAAGAGAGVAPYHLSRAQMQATGLSRAQAGAGAMSGHQGLAPHPGGPTLHLLPTKQPVGHPSASSQGQVTRLDLLSTSR